MSLWTSEDKRILLSTLHRYGPNNILALQNALPNKTKVEIQQICKEYSNKALKKLTENNTEAFIKHWITILRRLKSTQKGQVNDIIPRVLKYIALFEKRPHSDKVNIGELYLYLSQMSNGLVPEELVDTSDYFLFDCLKKQSNSLKCRGEMRSFKEYLGELESLNDLTTFRSNSKSKDGLSLNLNPLGIPANLMVLTHAETLLDVQV